MDDERSLLAEPQPESNAAAEAFARLEARVAGVERQMAVTARALEHIAIERQSIEVPDYSATLARISGVLTDMGTRIKAIEESPALEITPESMAVRFERAASAAREAECAMISKLQELVRQTAADSNRTMGTIRTKDQQRRHIVYWIGVTALAQMPLWLFYPGWVANTTPRTWLWPEAVARRTLGEPTLWDAGIRLMRAGNPEGWQAIVDAVEMRRSNRESVEACEQTAAKTKEPVRCSIRIGGPKL